MSRFRLKLSGRKTGLAVTVREGGREFDRNLREGGRVYTWLYTWKWSCGAMEAGISLLHFYFKSA